MRKTRRWIAALVIVLGNLAIAAPYAVRAVNQANEYKADWRDSDTGFRHKTDARVVELEVKPVATHVRFRLSMDLPRGTMSFRLADPLGNVRLEGDVVQGRGSFDSKEMPALVGVWKLDVKREDASGKYEAHWRVR